MTHSFNKGYCTQGVHCQPAPLPRYAALRYATLRCATTLRSAGERAENGFVNPLLVRLGRRRGSLVGTLLEALLELDELLPESRVLLAEDLHVGTELLVLLVPFLALLDLGLELLDVCGEEVLGLCDLLERPLVLFVFDGVNVCLPLHLLHLGLETLLLGRERRLLVAQRLHRLQRLVSLLLRLAICDCSSFISASEAETLARSAV